MRERERGVCGRMNVVVDDGKERRRRQNGITREVASQKVLNKSCPSALAGRCLRPSTDGP